MATNRPADSTLAARELGFLVRLAQAAASTQKPDELLALIIREATSAMGTDVCSLYLVRPSGHELLLTATNGLNENMVGKVKMRVGEGITGWVAVVAGATAASRPTITLAPSPPPTPTRRSGRWSRSCAPSARKW